MDIPVIDVLNSVDGDANNDEKVNMGDTVTIVQFIGNRSQYDLSAQEQFNADTNWDGMVTGEDAVIIQQRIAETGLSE